MTNIRTLIKQEEENLENTILKDKTVAQIDALIPSIQGGKIKQAAIANIKLKQFKKEDDINMINTAKELIEEWKNANYDITYVKRDRNSSVILRKPIVVEGNE